MVTPFLPVISHVLRYFVIPSDVLCQGGALSKQQEIGRKQTYLYKKKMLTDNQFSMNYKGFMEELLLKGCARESTKSPNYGQVWYLLHHGICHPSKPNKIRVVFDCSVEYKSRCLNNKLLPGTDLTNQLIGVLLRFRKETIVFMYG